ncbi:hypothetical protein [Natrinema salsiterrestre]|uniref:Putative peptidase inhibitor domain-containing protein n=1 Tax=Natrinema salsiterrestre TaxID=2950540 RepID=A0A9Q4L2F1_9EURY|nr:hypothetical protein [Natrinema salsiterrestre]MDF9744710.1 hypothetical protein [Natrinema salsiterrestre]
MPEYVDPAVEQLRESTAETPVTLLIGAAEDRSELERALSRFDVTIDSTIGRTALRVQTAEAVVDDLCELDAVSSIEVDHDDVEVLHEGNANSRQRVIR